MFTFYILPDTRVLNSFEELCIMQAAAENSFASVLNPYEGAYIYIYIYIYMCVCVCVCVWKIKYYGSKRDQNEDKGVEQLYFENVSSWCNG